MLENSKQLSLTTLKTSMIVTILSKKYKLTEAIKYKVIFSPNTVDPGNTICWKKKIANRDQRVQWKRVEIRVEKPQVRFRHRCITSCSSPFRKNFFRSKNCRKLLMDKLGALDKILIYSKCRWTMRARMINLKASTFN